MAAFKPELHDIDGVLNYYDLVKSPYYAIYAGARPDPNYLRFEFLEDDAAIGREALHEQLLAIEQNRQNNNTYTLQIMAEPPKGGSVTARKKGTAWPSSTKNITFQLNRSETVGAVGSYMSADPTVVRLLQKMDDRLQDLEERLNDAEGKGANPEVNSQLGAIGALLENPALQPIIGALAGKLVDWLEKPPAPAPTHIQPPPAINGIPGVASGQQEGEILSMVERMIRGGLKIEDLEKLALFAEKKPLQFKIYITMLRTMKI